MGGSSAPTVTGTGNANNGALTNLQSQQTAQQSQVVQNLLSQVSSGQLSIGDALNKISSGSLVGNQQQGASSLSNSPGGYVPQNPNNLTYQDIQALQTQMANTPNPSNLSQAALQQLATNPLTGSMLANYEVQNNPLYSGLFGAQGLQGQAENNYSTATGNLVSDRQSLLGNDPSYGLNDQDLQAYGQAATTTGNQIGASGNSLAQMLSQRGLGSSSAPSAQLYSGLLGNQNEQLAQQQLTIAQNRINTAQQLAQARTTADLQSQSQSGSLASNIGQLGLNAQNQQYGQQLAGSENNFNQQASLAGIGQQQQTIGQNTANAQQGQQTASTFNPASLLPSVITGAATIGAAKAGS